MDYVRHWLLAVAIPVPVNSDQLLSRAGWNKMVGPTVLQYFRKLPGKLIKVGDVSSPQIVPDGVGGGNEKVAQSIVVEGARVDADYV